MIILCIDASIICALNHKKKEEMFNHLSFDFEFSVEKMYICLGWDSEKLLDLITDEFLRFFLPVA